MATRRKTPVNLITTEPHACSVDLRLRILGKLPFFSGIANDKLIDINQKFVEVGYEAGQFIYSAGDSAERLFVVADGKVKLFQPTVSGRDVLLDILSTGEFFGNLVSLGTKVYPDTAQAQTSACILSIDSSTFRQIMDANPELTLKALEVVAARLNESNQRVLQLSSMSTEQRLASTLVKLVRKFGREKIESTLIDVPLSRYDLAEMTGTTPETVSRILSQFQTDGIINSGRQWIAVTNTQNLSDLAGE